MIGPMPDRYRQRVTLTILDGSTFCICDELGDIEGPLAGFFADDTRYVSLLRLTINGAPPLLLSSGKVEYFSAAFYMRNPLAGGLPQDSLTIVRRRFVGAALQDSLVVENTCAEPLRLELGLLLGSDFSDIFTVKARDFSLGHPADAPPLPPTREPVWDGNGCRATLDDGDGTSTEIVLSRPGARRDGDAVIFELALEPHERWELLVDLFPSTPRGRVVPRQQEQRFGDELRRVQDSLAAWELRVPQLRASWDGLVHSFGQSVADLASLRMHSDEVGGRLPAAGLPWFMTVFGRDTLITCLQTLMFGPELATTALEALAALQAREDDATIDAEPGKIVHEVRGGKAADRWFARYYGTVDATPLFLILLSEVWRWTGDRTIPLRLAEAARSALAWIDEHGDHDGDGFVEFERRSERGLVTQSWKDSHDSQKFRDGRIASAPIAPCEVQGYVYDAKLRLAEIAREVWRDRELADRLDGEAAELRRRFDDAYWIDERGGYYALALDSEKKRVDSLTSNIGHLLWSGIVPPERVEALVDRLMGEELWSGWGVRTMSTGDTGYNPLGYHTGTVWPHDNSLIAAGLVRYGRWSEAHRIARRMLDAARHFHWQLPEVFAGLPRGDTPFPVAYPTASRPQAWAAGTPILLLQLLLGLRPDVDRELLETTAPRDLPAWLGDVRLTGVRAFGRPWDIRLERGEVAVERA
jgi:glycogen debranching enzyme